MRNAPATRMNILFFMQDTGAVFGAERATIDLAHGLRAAGDDVRFFLIDETRRGISPVLARLLEQSGFPVESFPVRGRISLALIRELRRVFAACDGQVLHAVGYKANVHASLSGIRPVVSTVHGWLFRADRKERLFHQIDLICLRRCDRVICLSHFYQDLLLRSGIRPDRLNLIPSGLRELPVRNSRPPHGSGRPMTFGMLGRFSEEKNHTMFLEAAAQALRQRPGLKFTIAGSGPLEKMIRERSASLGLHQALTMEGYADVSIYFDRVDVYVICSRIENLPYSVLEAMARERAVIGTRVGGIPDLISEGETGLLVEPEQIAELAGAMIRLADDPVLAVQMGERGRRKMMDEFSFEKSVSAHRELYRGLPRVR